MKENHIISKEGNIKKGTQNLINLQGDIKTMDYHRFLDILPEKITTDRITGDFLHEKQPLTLRFTTPLPSDVILKQRLSKICSKKVDISWNWDKMLTTSKVSIGMLMITNKTDNLRDWLKKILLSGDGILLVKPELLFRTVVLHVEQGQIIQSPFTQPLIIMKSIATQYEAPEESGSMCDNRQIVLYQAIWNTKISRKSLVLPIHIVLNGIYDLVD